MNYTRRDFVDDSRDNARVESIHLRTRRDVIDGPVRGGGGGGGEKNQSALSASASRVINPGAIISILPVSIPRR